MAVANPETSADNIAPPVVWLASEASGWFTGQVVGVHGYEIGLFNTPQLITRLVSNGPWDMDSVAKQMDVAFRNALEGIDPSMRAALGRS